MRHPLRYLLLALLVLLMTGCDQLFPRDMEAYQVCGPVTPIRDAADSTHVLAWAQMCYTAYRAPAPESDE